MPCQTDEVIRYGRSSWKSFIWASGWYRHRRTQRAHGRIHQPWCTASGGVVGYLHRSKSTVDLSVETPTQYALSAVPREKAVVFSPSTQDIDYRMPVRSSVPLCPHSDVTNFDPWIETSPCFNDQRVLLGTYLLKALT